MNLTKKFLLRASAIASLVGIATVSLPAGAVDSTESADGSIVVSGLTNYGSYLVEYTGTPKVKRASANAGGVVSLRHSASFPVTSTSSFTRAGTTHSVASLTVGATPKCSNGSLAETPPAAVFKDSNGAVFLTGLTPYSSYEITYNSVPATRKSKANACGMISLKSSPGYPLSNSAISVKNITSSGTIGSEVENFTPSNLSANDIPICSKGKAYFPQGWSTGGGGGS